MITRLLRRSWVSVLFGVALIALTVAPTGAQEALPRNETLYVAGMQWSTFITFNPLADPGTFPAIGENTYTYETLFAFNVATGNIDPLLAKEVTFPDATTAVVTLQDGTHWQDGEPLTVDDVVFTFGLARDFAVRNYANFWTYVDEVTATGDRTIEFKMNPDRINVGQLKRFLSNVHILPQHIWGPRVEAGRICTLSSRRTR
ncbi:MAG: ABC transporter substrate-binding protein [Anaerolineae bacterium]|nr:ABC transporter substrate-binding protein [Anaerolineae bacterium]